MGRICAVVVGVELQCLKVRVRRIGRGPARRERNAFAAENAVSVGIGQCGREIRFRTVWICRCLAKVPFGKGQWRSGISGAKEKNQEKCKDTGRERKPARGAHSW